MLRDNSLLIMAKYQKSADKFLKVNNLANVCTVEVKLHDRLNSSKGIAYAPCLIHVTETEIVNEMKNQGVTEVYKYTKNDDKGKPQPSGLMLFTFNLFNPPKSIEIGFYNARVTEYVPNPMRCKNCQLFGHTTKRCNGNTKCDTCSLPPHSPDLCSRIMCANCSLEHPSSSKTCPSYRQAKEILVIKTTNKCTMGEAKRMYKDRNPTQIPTSSNTFAEKLKQNISNQKNTQVQETTKTNSPQNSLKIQQNTNNLSSSENSDNIKDLSPLPFASTSYSQALSNCPSTNTSITTTTPSKNFSPNHLAQAQSLSNLIKITTPIPLSSNANTNSNISNTPQPTAASPKQLPLFNDYNQTERTNLDENDVDI